MKDHELNYISFNKHDIQFSKEPLFNADNENGNSIFEFKFKEEKNFSFCGISISSTLRKNQTWQNMILSITDFSNESDKKPVLFVGDMLNFCLNPDTSHIYKGKHKKNQWPTNILNHYQTFEDFLMIQLFLDLTRQNIIDYFLK